MIAYEWRAEFTNEALKSLHAEAFGPGETAVDWYAQVHRHSLGWVCAHEDRRLVGFVNVAWDGGAHAFLLDTMVARDRRQSGVGAELVATAVRGARAANCAWIHVDFEKHLQPFYFEACGFSPTRAGLIALR
ncbi:GNAT family N-acetyltransferase [Kineosporia sp. NBRC 101731]|uniref:GNAT family N-acetyltransferase n=1 Tax=Kineosporia sp. NBRC 101731 TaxID=3032199 RepID=UPI00249FCF9D|nr:GNAT family N-acetyltransferase [Kineosporia sp. NBRC 101731]GLY31579.1 N-acetyltransferase [Kineosporia sp. NBRC 101731]